MTVTIWIKKANPTAKCTSFFIICRPYYMRVIGTYNEFVYGKTKDVSKLEIEDKFQKKGLFSIVNMQNCILKRPHITKYACVSVTEERSHSF
jgi:hypothetical protein